MCSMTSVTEDGRPRVPADRPRSRQRRRSPPSPRRAPRQWLHVDADPARTPSDLPAPAVRPWRCTVSAGTSAGCPSCSTTRPASAPSVVKTNVPAARSIRRAGPRPARPDRRDDRPERSDEDRPEQHAGGGRVGRHQEPRVRRVARRPGGQRGRGVTREADDRELRGPIARHLCAADDRVIRPFGALVVAPISATARSSRKRSADTVVRGVSETVAPGRRSMSKATIDD